MNVPRRRCLPLVFAHGAAAGAFLMLSWQTTDASMAMKRLAGNMTSSAEQEISARDVGDVVRGESLYAAKCGACHSVEQNRIGPKHRGVFGRRIGGVEDYDYSAALTGVDRVWDNASLDEWLLAPTEMFPGARMGFAVKDDRERADIIAYLKSVSE
ncbi:MAG: c-type cytochrome [Pseudomonadota bacterium]